MQNVEVIAEIQDKRPDQQSTHLGVILFALSFVAVGAFLLHMNARHDELMQKGVQQQKKGYQAMMYAEIQPEKNTERMRMKTDRRHNVNGTHRVSSALDRLEQKLARMDKAVGQQQALQEVGYKISNGERLDEKNSKELLHRAGYTQTAEEVARERAYKEQLAAQMKEKRTRNKSLQQDGQFAKSVVKTVVAEEVESFFERVHLVANVGTYIYERASN